MYKILFSAILLFAASLCATAQPSKNKPAAKPAPAVKKIDYPKLKAEVRSLFQDEKYNESITKANQYLLKYPGDTQTVYIKSACYIVTNRKAEGFNNIKKFFKANDTVAMYLAIMSFSLPEKYRLNEGIACADEAINLAPQNPWGYFAKGGTYSDFKKHEEAIGLIEKACQLATAESDKKIMQALYAKELAINGQYEKAITTINQLYEKYPKDLEITYDYGMIYHKAKQYEKALAKLDEAVAISPDDAEILAKRIVVLDASGKNEMACAEAEKLIAKDNSYEFMRYRYKCAAFFAAPKIADINTAIWEVDFNGSYYDFAIRRVKGDVDSGLEFAWSMTSGDDMNGHITISKEAMNTAIAQSNRFSAGMKDVVFNDKTTVWISKAVFANLVNKGSCKMDVGEGEEEFTIIPDVAENRDNGAFEDFVEVNGENKYLNTLHVKNKDASRELWILNDAKNPLIIKMQLGWSIRLKSIE